MITVSPEAVEWMKKRISLCNPEGGNPGFRIWGEQGECTGLFYGLTMEWEAREGDEILDLEGIPLYLGEETQPLAPGLIITVVDTPDGPGIKLQNPTLNKVCLTCGPGCNP